MEYRVVRGLRTVHRHDRGQRAVSARPTFDDVTIAMREEG
jgi:hypothetical protein